MSPSCGEDLRLHARGAAVWAAGDYSRVAAPQVLVGELLAETADLRAGERVLDVATGSGNAALSAARRRCEVVGVDLVGSLLQHGRARASAEGLRVAWVRGDGEQLPFRDHHFRCVLSTFGTMFAGNGAAAANELRRVCTSPGRIGLTCWVPEGFPGVLFELLDRSGPSAHTFRGVSEWGSTAGLRRLFGANAEIRASEQTLRMRADSPESYLSGLKRFFGPVIVTLARLDAARQATLEEEIAALIAKGNESTDGTVLLRARYLEAIIALP